jgi:hypothetical protein
VNFFYIAHGETHPEKHIGTRRMLVSHDCISLFFADTFFFSLIGCFQSRPCGCTCRTTFSGSFFFVLLSISQSCATSATSYYLTLVKKLDYDSVSPSISISSTVVHSTSSLYTPPYYYCIHFSSTHSTTILFLFIFFILNC